MAGGFDGSVNIDTGIDTRGFKAGMDGILNAAKKGATEVNKAFSTMSVEQQLKVLDDTVKRVGEKFDYWPIDEKNAAIQETITGVKAVGKAFEDMSNSRQMEIMGETVQRVGADFGMWPLDKQNEALQDTIDGVDRLADGTIRVVKDTEKLVESTEKVAYLTDEFPVKTNKWGTAISGVKRGFLQMASALVPGLYRINRFSLGIDRVTTSATGAGAALTKAFTGAAVTVVIIAVLIAALVGLFMGLYKQMLRMDGFKENVKGLELAFANLKNAAYSAIMPLFNAILPIVMQVVGWLTEAANAAAAFIAALSGSSTYMVYVADSVGSAADSAGQLAENTEAAGDAAKGALAGFDKLNVLQMAGAGGGGGGGGGGSGGSGHWEERIISDETVSGAGKVLDFFAGVKLFFEDVEANGWEAAFRNLFKPLEPGEVPSLMDGFILALGGFMDDVDLSVTNFIGHIKEWGLGAAIEWELNPANWFKVIPDSWLDNLIGYFKPYVAGAGGDIIEGLKNGISDALLSFDTWLKLHVLDPFVKWFKELFGIASPSTVMEGFGTSIIDGFKKGIEDKWALVKESLSAVWGGISDWFTNGAAAIWVTDTVDKLRVKLGDIVSGAKGKLGEIWVGLTDWFTSGDVNTWGGDTVTRLKTVLGNIVSGAKGKLADIWGGMTDWFTGGDVNTWGGDIVTRLKTVLSNIVAGAKGKLGEIWGGMTEWFTGGDVNMWVTDTIDDLKTALGSIVTGAKTKLGEVWNGIGDWFATSAAAEWIKNSIADLKTALGKIVTGAKTALGAIWTGLFTTTTKTLDVKVTFAQQFKDVLNSLIGSINAAINKLLNNVNAVIMKLNGIHFTVFGKDYSIFDIDYIIPPAAGWVPYLAKGAVIPPNAAFAAILGDQRSGTNIEAPENLIRQIIREEMGGQGSNQRITVDFGSSSLGALIRTLNPVIKQENDRRGNSLLSKGIA